MASIETTATLNGGSITLVIYEDVTGDGYADNEEQVSVADGTNTTQLSNLENDETMPYVTVVYTTCAVGLLAFVAAAGFPLVGYPPQEWLLFLAMAVGPGIFGHTVINWTLEDVESTVVGVALVGEPVGSTVLAALLLGEVPGLLTVVGGLVVLTGIVVTARSRAESA